ncbi:hypothetical protein ACFFRR_005395 [Megaselia abdita]
MLLLRSRLDNSLEFGPIYTNMFLSSSSNSNKNTSPGDKTNEHPFARKTKLLRSPNLKSNPKHQHQLKEALNKNETNESQEKEKVVVDNSINEKLKKFEKMCEALQKEGNDLKIEKALKKNEKNNENDLQMEIEASSVDDYHTDEDEFAREIEWILRKNKKKNSKKRKAESSPEMDTSVKSYKGLVTVIKANQKEYSKNPKLPPVILSNINDFSKVQDVMSSQNIKYEV